MRALRPFFPSFCLFLALLSVNVHGQLAPDVNVTTWHNDINRTGQQLYETALTPVPGQTGSVSQSTFGLVGQYSVQGKVYAQPLAVGNVSVQDHTHCPSPCNLVFIATEQDMLYAFNADPSVSTAAVWSTDLAAQAAPGGTAVDCSVWTPPCAQGVIYPYMGVTGTPVIDVAAGVLYVVSLVQFGGAPPPPAYYLHAIDITNGHEKGTPIAINATVTGQAPIAKCGTAGGGGQVTFDSRTHIQRNGLLLLTATNSDSVYIGFANGDHGYPNGWVFGYTL